MDFARGSFRDERRVVVVKGKMKNIQLVCPYCGEIPDMEIGPDDEMPEAKENAILIQMIEGEDVEKYDTLLSLAITGGDYSWI